MIALHDLYWLSGLYEGLDLAETACAARDEALAQVKGYKDTLVQFGPVKLWALKDVDEPILIPEPETLAALLDRLQRAEARVEELEAAIEARNLGA